MGKNFLNFLKLLIGHIFVYLLLIGPSDLYAQGETVLTLMAIYTEDAEEWADLNRGGIDNVIAQGIAYTNQAIKNSNLNVKVKLVHSEVVEYEETRDSQMDLLRLEDPDDGYLDEVPEWRNKYRADFVILIQRILDFSGRAFGNFDGPSPLSSYSTIEVAATPGSTFAHELGHNFGFAHSRNQEDFAAGEAGGLFTYSTGWRWKGNDNGYVSIMTYRDGDTRIPNFSNPDISYRGTPTGSYSGVYAPADNARSLRESKHELASFRLNEVPELLFPRSDANSISVSPKFEWKFSDFEIAEAYVIQISQDPSFEQDIDMYSFDESPGVFSIKFFEYDTKYYWRMRAINKWVSYSKWSDAKSFKTELPTVTEVQPSYPNPFNNQVTFKVEIADQRNLKIELFDLTGRSIETIINEEKLPGVYNINYQASSLSSGVYFARFLVGDLEEVQKITLLK